MSDNFTYAIPFVLHNEGGFCDNPLDKGQATNFGITQRFLDGLVKSGKYTECTDVANLTVEQAIDVYHRFWWNVYGYDAIDDKGVSFKILDSSINLGAHEAHKQVQRACGDCKHPVPVDGNLGAHSFVAINACDSIALHNAIRARLCNFYKGIVAKHPEQKVFLKGWLVRANQ